MGLLKAREGALCPAFGIWYYVGSMIADPQPGKSSNVSSGYSIIKT